MKKVIVLLVIVAAALLTPFITGKIIEDRFEAKIALINQKFSKAFPQLAEDELVQLEYHAGWFTSSAKTTIDKLVINHHIVHGPYGVFGVAKIDTRFEIPKHVEKELVTFFDGKQPYTINTKIGFTGTTQFDIKSPAIVTKNIPSTRKSISITWQGLDFSSTFSKETVTSSFKMPKFAVTEEGEANFLIENINSKVTGNRLLDKELNLVLPKNFKLTSESSIDKIAFESLSKYSPASLQLNNITTQVKSDNNINSNLTIGDIAFSTDDVLFNVSNVSFAGSINDPLWILRGDPAAVDWNAKLVALAKDINFTLPEEAIKVTLDYQQEQQITDSDNKVGYGELYKVANLDMQLPNYSNFISNAELGYQINGLPKKQLSVLVTDYIDFLKLMFNAGFNNGYNKHNTASSKDIYQDMMDFQTKLVRSMQDIAVAALQGTPELTVNFNLDGNKGAAKLNFHASLVTPETSTDDLQLLTMGATPRISAKLSVTSAETLVDEILTTANVPTDQQQAFKQEALLRYPIQQNNGQYSSEIEFKNGNFYVNGKLDPAFLQKYSQQLKNFN